VAVFWKEGHSRLYLQPQELVPARIRSEKIFRHGVVFGRGSAVQIDMTARQAGTRQRAMIDVNVRRKPSPRHMRGQRASIGASPEMVFGSERWERQDLTNLGRDDSHGGEWLCCG